MACRFFEDREHAVCYQKYRMCPSEELVGRLLAFLEIKKGRPFCLAVDVGCGSGQGTLRLAPHFKEVIGMDISAAQLETAQARTDAPNISYRQCPAEELPLEDASADLVASMSAAHWFDWPRFIREAFRILRPDGCLALLNYTMDMKLEDEKHSQELNGICSEFYSAVLPYRCAFLGPRSVPLYKEMFDSIPYPEKEWHDGIWVKHAMPLSSFIGMLETFSMYQAFLKENPEEAKRLSQDTTQRLLAVMGETSPEVEVVIGIQYYYIVARKPAVA
ncbi:putative methyltransferase DDB_G0268948 [Scleropages formosus]|uniref:Si:ch211-93g23.2 n=1 Tax=Scleropages formosus TaxID=113540 RepID=A0A8C9S2Y0_SCLFO|nr:putative methyltransferase DDB_G0268948 [Scleropages formosus]